MKSGHLDMETGRWVDETEAADDEAFAAEQTLHPPVGSPEARSGAPSPAAAMVPPQVPLSLGDKARMMQFVRGNAGNPDEVSAAREQLLRGSAPVPIPGPGGPPVGISDAVAFPGSPGGPPVVPDVRAVDVGADGLVRPSMPGAPPDTMTPADRAREIQRRRGATLAGVR